jgi:hypothetical protein
MITFTAYALKNIRIDQDNAGLFCQVPSQDGNWYTVRCVESKKSVHASHCSCRTFAKKQSCGHVELVQAYWNKIYKVEAPVEVAPVETAKPVKAPKVKRTPLVRKVRNGGLVKVAQPAPVAKVIAQAVEATVPVAKTTDISKKGNFGTKAFSLMR